MIKNNCSEFRNLNKISRAVNFAAV